MRLTLRLFVLASAAMSCSAQFVQAQGLGAADPNMPEVPEPQACRLRVLSVAAGKTWLVLNTPISLPFEEEVSLADVLKYVKQATAGPNDKGLSIYVDPVALRQNDATMASKVAINVEGVPLATGLALVLKQHNLAFGVQKDGIVVIGSASSLSACHAGPVTDKQVKVWMGLDRRLDVSFEKRTSLEDMIKFVKAATRGEDGKGGLRIYVDTFSLNEHDMVVDQDAISMDLQDVPLSTALQLMLSQMQLVFSVEEAGIIVIRHKEDVSVAPEDELASTRDDVQSLKRELFLLRKEVEVLKARNEPAQGIPARPPLAPAARNP